MNRAVLYARTSGDDRGKGNLDDQIKLCRDYAEDKGYVVVDEVREDSKGASGADIDLPGIMSALSMAESGQFDVLVVRELDRFARGMGKQLALEKQFKNAGVQVDYALGEYPDTPEGNLMKHIKAAIAEYERELIRIRTMRKRYSIVRNGEPLVHGHPPFGYRVKKTDGRRELVIHADEGYWIEQMYCWCDEGVTITEITNRLTEEQVQSWSDVWQPGRSGRERGTWSIDMVSKILKSERYRGVWYYGKFNSRTGKANPEENWIEVSIPAIVDEGLWNRVQNRLDGWERMPENYDRKYLVRQRVTCGVCGRPAHTYHCNYTTTKGEEREYTYYVCSSIRHGDQECSLPYFKRQQVDERVWRVVREYVADPEFVRARFEHLKAEVESRPDNAMKRLETVEGLIADTERKRERAVNLYIEGGLDKETILPRIQTLETQIKSLEQERDRAKALVEQPQKQIEAIERMIKKADDKDLWLAMADGPFEHKLALVEMMDTQVTLDLDEDGEKVIGVRCLFGEEFLHEAKRTSCGTAWSVGPGFTTT